MWIESHQSLRNHPKVKKAARLAGISESEMIGRLHYLWWWALDYAPDGDVTKYSQDDIESAVDWEGTSGKFYKALLECGFNGHCGLLEKSGRTICIHDWHDYAGKLIERRADDAERKRNSRKRMSTGRPEDSAETACVPNLPNQPTEPNQPNLTNHTYQETVGVLEDHFSKLTGIPKPPRISDSEKKASAKAWWNPLGIDIYKNLCSSDEALAIKVIEATVQHMASDNLTISCPRSIVNVAASELGKLNGRVTGNGNGQNSEPSNPMLRAIARREGKLT